MERKESPVLNSASLINYGSECSDRLLNKLWLHTFVLQRVCGVISAKETPPESFIASCISSCHVGR